MKKCRNCNSEVPEDSDFCPFCGSSNLCIVNENTGNNQIKNNINTKSYKIHFILALAVCGVLCLYIFLNESKFNAIGSIENRYSMVLDTANQNCSADFHPDAFVIKGTDSKIRVYCNFPNTEVYWNINFYGTDAEASTYSAWQNDSNGFSFFDITLNCTYDSYGNIIFTNNYNEETFTVYFSGS